MDKIKKKDPLCNVFESTRKDMIPRYIRLYGRIFKIRNRKIFPNINVNIFNSFIP